MSKLCKPRIGIRPTIDGRFGGVRESLEGKTMAMAQAASELISQLRHPDGSPVECVIAPSTIGGVAEAAACQAHFEQQNVCATLTVTPCWCYGSETMDMDPRTTKAVWGFNGTERPGAVYLAAVMAAHAQKGLPAFSIYGRDVQDLDDDTIPHDVRAKILSFAQCAIAMGNMRGKSYVNMGAVSMGIAGSYYNEEFFSKFLGIRPEWVDLTEILRRMKLDIFDVCEHEKALAWARTYCKEGRDINAAVSLQDMVKRSKVVSAEDDWDFVTKMAVIIKDIMHGNPKLADLGWHEEALGKNAIAGGFQGQRHWTDWLPNGDFAEAILASSFDWNGARPPIVLATENDSLNAASMLFGLLLTNTAPCFHDVRTFWSADAVARVCGVKPGGLAKDGFIHLINSGACALDGSFAAKDADGNGTIKPWWDMTEADISACLDATRWCRAEYQYFRGGGYSSQFDAKAQAPVTLIRVNIVDGMGPVLQIAEGSTILLDSKINDILSKRTSPTWPSTWFVPKITGAGAFKDVYSVMAAWGANHGVTAIGHVGDRLITLASMLRIPVVMHNVPSDRIFRPHAWGGFGTACAESADIRACGVYGAMYG